MLHSLCQPLCIPRFSKHTHNMHESYPTEQQQQAGGGEGHFVHCRRMKNACSGGQIVLRGFLIITGVSLLGLFARDEISLQWLKSSRR